jgi:hypothetical protein
MWPFKPDVKILAQRGNVRGLVDALCRARCHPLDRIEAALALGSAGTDDVEDRLKTVVEKGLNDAQQYFDATVQNLADNNFIELRSVDHLNRATNAVINASLSLFALSAMDKHRLAEGGSPIRKQIDGFVASHTDCHFLVGVGANMLAHHRVDHKLVAGWLVLPCDGWDTVVVDRKLRLLESLAVFSSVTDMDKERSIRVFIRSCLGVHLLTDHSAKAAWNIVARYVCSTGHSSALGLDGIQKTLFQLAPELWRYDVPVQHCEGKNKFIPPVEEALRAMDPKCESHYAAIGLLEWVRTNRSEVVRYSSGR